MSSLSESESKLRMVSFMGAGALALSLLLTGCGPGDAVNSPGSESTGAGGSSVSEERDRSKSIKDNVASVSAQEFVEGCFEAFAAGDSQAVMDATGEPSGKLVDAMKGTISDAPSMLLNDSILKGFNLTNVAVRDKEGALNSFEVETTQNGKPKTYTVTPYSVKDDDRDVWKIDFGSVIQTAITDTSGEYVINGKSVSLDKGKTYYAWWGNYIVDGRFIGSSDGNALSIVDQDNLSEG